MVQIKGTNAFGERHGSFGGSYYKKDSHGQHVQKKPRVVRSEPTQAQKWQRAWYSSKKYAEKFPYPDFPPPEDNVPPGTHVVYSLDSISAFRKPSLFEPVKTDIVYAGFWVDQIQIWVDTNWQPGYAVWGLTKQLMFLMTVKWFFVTQSSWGFGAAVAFEAAKANMLNFISTSASAVAVPALILWVGLIGIQVFFAFLDFIAGASGHIDFNVGRVLIRKDSTVWFGGLVGRPSKDMYDFSICQLSPYDGVIRHKATRGWPYVQNWFENNDLWQTISRGLIFWYCYTWGSATAYLRGKGYRIGENLIRMNVNPSQHAFWNKPIGWWQSSTAACAYLNQFDDFWAAEGAPHTPL